MWIGNIWLSASFWVMDSVWKARMYTVLYLIAQFHDDCIVEGKTQSIKF